MLIYLIGFMGSGKTTIGKELASKLGYSFFDIDQEIEEHFHLKVAEIFEKHGELAFREAERDWISKSRLLGDSVISTGGGSPCFYNNMEMMNQLGITIYLKTDSKTLTNRLKGSRNNRPLIKEKTDFELFEYVNAKLIERQLFYEKSKLTIHAFDIKVQDIIIILASM